MKNLTLKNVHNKSLTFSFKKIDYIELFFKQHSQVSIFLEINIGNGFFLSSKLEYGEISMFFEKLKEEKESFFVFTEAGVTDKVNFSEFDLNFENGMFPFQSKEYELNSKNIKFLYLLLFEWYRETYFYYVI